MPRRGGFNGRGSRHDGDDRASQQSSLHSLEPSATEQEVGITYHLTKCEGIGGVLKQRFSDFVVREIQPDGSVTTLEHVIPQISALLTEIRAKPREKRVRTEPENGSVEPDTTKVAKTMTDDPCIKASERSDSDTARTSITVKDTTAETSDSNTDHVRMPRSQLHADPRLFRRRPSQTSFSMGEYLCGSKRFQAAVALHGMLPVESVEVILALVDKIYETVAYATERRAENNTPDKAAHEASLRTKFPGIAMFQQYAGTVQSATFVLRSSKQLQASIDISEIWCYKGLTEKSDPIEYKKRGKAFRAELHHLVRSLFPFLDSRSEIITANSDAQKTDGDVTNMDVDVTNTDGNVISTDSNVTDNPSEPITRFTFVIKSLSAIDLAIALDLPNSQALSAFVMGKPMPNRQQLNQSNQNNRYLHFTLYKFNIDTMTAIHRISKMLRIPSKSFSYAGTKDRRGITAQRVSVLFSDIQRLAGINHAIGNMRVGSIVEKDHPLRLGDLEGNEFEIALRSIHWKPQTMPDISTNEICPDVVKEWSQQSFRFVNYFGLQRFGSQLVPTHLIGRSILSGHFYDAIALILRINLWEDSEIELTQSTKTYLNRAAQLSSAYDTILSKFKETNDIRMISKELPHVGSVEQTVLNALKKYGLNRPIEAIKAIPRNTRLLYVHAYQSYLWNKLASHRLSTYGHLSPVVGDLVWSNDEKSSSVQVTSSTPNSSTNHISTTHMNGEISSKQAVVSEGNNHSSHTLYCDGETCQSGQSCTTCKDCSKLDRTQQKKPKDQYKVDQEEQSNITEIHYVTQEDIDTQRYSITDIFLPIPGYATSLPTYATGKSYLDDLLKEDGFELSEPSSIDTTQDINMSQHPIWGRGAPVVSLDMGTLAGQYRPLICSLRNVEWELLPYTDVKSPLFESDLDKLALSDSFIGGFKFASKHLSEAQACRNTVEQERQLRKQLLEGHNEDTCSHEWALKLKFRLDKGSYATMALREVMKMSTRKSDMAARNV